MKLRELFSDPKVWIQGSSARDARGLRCTLENGVSFCLVGGVHKCYHLNSERNVIFDKIDSEIHDDVAHWNDSHTHEDVLALCTKLDI